jgi:hypothetical protein
MSETIRFLRGAVRKPQAAQAFEDLVLQAPFITGEVIYGFPLNCAPGEGIFAVDAVLISPQGQVTVIDFVETAHPGDYRDRQDQAFTAVDRKLRTQTSLMNRRTPRIQVQTASFAPGIADPEHPLLNRETLVSALEGFQAEPPEEVTQAQVLDAILYVNSDSGFW